MTGPILVTGANGFIGSHVVENLLQGGYSVRCLLRPRSQPVWIANLPVDIQRADYADAKALANVVTGCTAILHFGGATKALNTESYHHANVETTRALLEAAKSACPELAIFLLCSSQAALGPSPSLEPLSEEAPPQPLSIYGQSKLAAEIICRDYADRFPITILRLPAVYGPRDRDIHIFFRLINWGIAPVIGKGERYLSLVNTLDIASLTNSILKQSPDGFRIYHVTDGSIHSWSEISDAIASALHKRPLKLRIHTGAAAVIGKILSLWSAAAGRVATLNKEKLQEILQSYWLMSSKKVELELGFKSEYNLEKGVELTARWYKANHWL